MLEFTSIEDETSDPGIIFLNRKDWEQTLTLTLSKSKFELLLTNIFGDFKIEQERNMIASKYFILIY